MATETNNELRKQIEVFIEPWLKVLDVPPFTPGELIVMALVMSDTPLRASQIVEWVCLNFRYYNRLSAVGMTCAFSPYSSLPRGSIERQIERFNTDFSEALQSYAMPIVCLEVDAKAAEAETHETEQYSIGSAGAALYLQSRYQEQSNQTTFPLLQLPAELRTVIYEMVFQFPLMALELKLPDRDHRGSGKNATRLTASHKNPGLDFSFNIPERHAVNIGPVDEILRLLLVNKQTYLEVVSCFYSIDTFYFDNVYDLSDALEALTPSRRRHIENIAFEYDSYYDHGGPAAFRLLATLENLQTLRIKISEEDWTGAQSSEKFNILKIPGLPTLRCIRGLKKAIFEGGCPNIAAHLKPEMEKPKQSTKATVRSRKRKQV